MNAAREGCRNGRLALSAPRNPGRPSPHRRQRPTGSVLNRHAPPIQTPHPPSPPPPPLARTRLARSTRAADSRSRRPVPPRSKPRSTSGGGRHGPDPVLREVLRRHLRVQARRPPAGSRQAPPEEPPPRRERVARAGRAAEPGMGALRGAPAGAPHHALPPPAQLPAAAGRRGGRRRPDDAQVIAPGQGGGGGDRGVGTRETLGGPFYL